MSILSRILVASALALGLASAVAAEPLFTVTEDGSAFIYKARPGDQPGTVAAMFGIGPREMPAFLADNGVTDPTRVGVGHVYRIPNPLAARAAAAEVKAQAFERDVGSLKTRADQFSRDLDAARAAAADAERRVARLARLERLWPLVSIVGMLLVVTAGILGWLASAALRKTDVAERRARALADEVEEKRRLALAERQQSAKRVLDLEAKVRDLEHRVAAPAPTPVRRSPAGTG
ncbi:MAG: hypothetical protein HY271_05040 [Deltaproteobacteria bacterium]|nr:hypothetical protein [Deltaproteobacteria bacterium]